MIQRLNNLEILKVTGNSITEVFGFEGLEEGRRYLERLKELRLDNLSQLASIWKGPCQLADFRNVKTVIVIKCNKLKFLFSPSMSQGLLQLEELWVEDCSDLDEIIQKDGDKTAEGIPNTPVFENLQELHIHNMESVKEMCVGQLSPGSFEKLKFLEVTGNSITEVFGFEGLEEGRRYLERLKELRLDNLSQLASIWKGPCQLADFRNVKTVIVIKCNKLKFLFSPSMSQGLLQLEELWVEDCSDLDEIIQKDEFPFLEHLHVRDCPNFRTPNFHSSKQVHFNNERHYNLLKKRLKEPEDMSNAVE
nr:hypothetical protein CFP56_74340 [Quercus suber]